ncbi:MAG: aminopeptidase P family protein [Bacteroidales bacterium]|nr:aminopeptidase P family protein [Bacteroidales bacterium]
MNIIQQRLKALRAEMQNLNLDAWYISGTDPHSNEYLPSKWQTREFISGFTGSFGTVIVTKNEAGLWTDTRYFIQAAEQIEGTGITMYKLRVPEAISPENWLVEKLSAGNRVGIDAQTISVAGYRNLHKALVKKEIELLNTPDLFKTIWDNRPQLSSDKIFELDTSFSGFSRKQKQTQLADNLNKIGADFQVVSMLDELAWLLNLRGSDISYNPVFMGFGLIGKDENYLFVSKSKIPSDLLRILENDGVCIVDYDSFYTFLSTIKNKRILIDPLTANFLIYNYLVENNELIESTSLISLSKALKNNTELNGFREAMKKDGVALVEFLFWLKTNIGKSKITEYEIGRKLAEFRSKQNNFKGESFPPIVGYKSHGAIVHLSVGPNDAFSVEAEGILLFDSGGQYLDGTTDITRTVALGQVTEQQKTDFTLVLKGMISLTLAEFPLGTKGCHLDILARKPLWENGMNYGHGTGHGVGHFLNVHEGPMSIRQEFNEHRIEPGMVMSNEPAFYREGEYGIRTENMMVCVEKKKTAFGQFLGFETLSVCPIDRTLIKPELLNIREKSWLNSYHEMVNELLNPLLNKELNVFLDELTKKI